MTQAPLNLPVDDEPQDVVLVVDDNPNNLRVLSTMLEQAGFRVRVADNGDIALRSTAIAPPDLILLDIQMPKMDGYEVCRTLKRDPKTKDIPVIFISALHETKDKVAAFRAGGMDYISKPFNVEEVLARVQTHLKLYRMQRHLEERVASKTQELRSTYESLQVRERQFSSILFQTIEVMAKTVEKRDPYTAGHQERVAYLAEKIARQMEMEEEQIVGLRLSAMIHDIGKLSVPSEILSRPGRLAETEFALVKAHAETGYEIVKDVEFPWPVAQIIRQHHERMDGSGYPQGLKGDEILPEARILAVADVCEAMASHRPYRPARGVERALEELKNHRGTLYDPDSVDALLALVDAGIDPLVVPTE
jgi:putative two-component system response regulator